MALFDFELAKQMANAGHDVKVQVRNPREAEKVFAQVPRQRNVFVVQFQPNGSTGANPDVFRRLSFVVKTVDRPRIIPKAEELHQYNKKRQIYTGYKIEPVKMQFYDDAEGTAQRMWKDYSGYYFGDFNPANYSYDVVGTQFVGGLANYGYTVNRIQDGAAQFYFDHIDVLQIYGNTYDQYRLVNPRITQFDPDDFDYENNGVCLISMQVSYENLQYTIGQRTKELAEFDPGASFDGNVPRIVASQVTYPANVPPTDATSITTPVEQWLSAVPVRVGQLAEYRRVDSLPGAALQGFGKYSFGALDASKTKLGSNAFAKPLDLGLQVDPLSIDQWSIPSVAATMKQRGFDGASFDVAQAKVEDATTGYGDVQDQLVAGVVAAQDLSVDTTHKSIDGLVLAPPAYAAVNARETGTAQYGFNTSGSLDPSSTRFWSTVNLNSR